MDGSEDHPLKVAADLTPPVPQHATPEQCVAMWMDLMDASEQLLLAGLREDVGPDGDLRAAYRQWYAGQMVERDGAWQRMAENRARAGEDHAG